MNSAAWCRDFPKRERGFQTNWGTRSQVSVERVRNAKERILERVRNAKERILERVRNAFGTRSERVPAAFGTRMERERSVKLLLSSTVLERY